MMHRFNVISVTCIYILTVVIQTAALYDRSNSGLTSMPTDIPNNEMKVLLVLNRIREIPLSTWSGHVVTWLSMNANELTEYPDLSPLGLTLERLFLWSNEISYINEAYLTSLQVLKFVSLHTNKLTAIPNAHVTTLATLYFPKNQFTEVPDLSNMKGIKQLRLQENPLITEVSKDTFYGYNLTKLFLSETSITSMPDLRHVRNTLKDLKLTATTSLTKAGITEMATLITIGNLLIAGTSLTLLPTSCPTNVTQVNIEADPGQLDLCHCSMIWMKVRK